MIRYSTTAVLLALFAVIGFSQDEDVSESIVQNFVVRSIAWDIENRPSVLVAVMTRIRLLENELLLAEKEIREELEIVPTQATALEMLLDSSALQANRLLLKWGGNLPRSDEDLKEWQHIRQSMQSQLEDILLPHQMERLNQVANRVKLRQVGLRHFFEKNPGELGLDVSNKIRLDILTKIDEISNQIHREFVDEVPRSVKNVLADLSDSQMSKLDEAVQAFGNFDDLDIYLAQLNYFCNNEELRFGTRDSKAFEAMVEHCPTLTFTFDGRFQCVKYNTDPQSLPTFIEKLSNLSTNPLAATIEQFRKFDEINSRYWHGVKLLQNERDRKLELNGKISHQENEIYVEEMTNLANSKLKFLEEVLSPSQLEKVRQLYSASLLSRYGLVCCIACGELGESIELSDVQRNSIREKCRSEIKRLEGKLLFWDQEMFSSVRSILDADLKTKFDKVFGPPMKHVIPTLRMMVVEVKK